MSSWLAIHTSLRDKLASPVQHETVAETGQSTWDVRTARQQHGSIRQLDFWKPRMPLQRLLGTAPCTPLYPTLPAASWQAVQMTSYSKRMPVTIRPFDKCPGGVGSCT